MVQGSRDTLESAALARQARDEWTALWPELRALPASRRILSVCDFCRRARAPGGAWTFIPARILDALQVRPSALPLSHGVCPPCLWRHYGMEMEDLDSAG